ncbi:MAG: DUF4173 domain-containing protein [Flavobacteriales bacterium]|nr:DUF4173 domain-containing protein [Flavobacteriales bacterium]
MKPLKPILLVLVSAIVFTLIFYKQALGLNVLIYELLVIAYLSITKQIKWRELNYFITASGVLLTVVFTVLHHSSLSFFVNFLLFILFVGVMIAPELRSPINSLKISIFNLFSSPINYRNEYIENNASKKRSRINLRRLGIFVVPLIIIFTFIFLYSLSSHNFSAFMNDIADFISEKTSFLLDYVDFWLIVTFAIGFVISAFIFIRKHIKSIILNEQRQSDELARERLKHTLDFKFFALKNEYKSAVFLFGALNALLLTLNILDIDTVWFNFEWEGQYLKYFVHFGTYVLIASIILSIALVLYFFRNNLNFYPNNKLLKVLCYVWLAQNIILAISVGIRNWHYIEHFALAYKRIGVLFFLLLAVFGLMTVVKKVRDRKSYFYVARINSVAWIVVFTLAAGVNWDKIIAKYNFRNADQSFVHLNFLATLSDSALPELDKSQNQLSNIQVVQEEKFSPFMKSGSSSINLYSRVYMTPEQYYNRIQVRKHAFKSKWESKGFLAWNWAEHQAYEELFGSD